MSESSPFILPADVMSEIETTGRALVEACAKVAAVQFAGAKSDVPGGDVVLRSIASIAIQQVLNSALDAGVDGFNLLDGVANAVAVITANHDHAAESLRFVLSQTRGYHDRYAPVMALKKAAAQGRA